MEKGYKPHHHELKYFEEMRMTTKFNTNLQHGSMNLWSSYAKICKHGQKPIKLIKNCFYSVVDRWSNLFSTHIKNTYLTEKSFSDSKNPFFEQPRRIDRDWYNSLTIVVNLLVDQGVLVVGVRPEWHRCEDHRVSVSHFVVLLSSISFGELRLPREPLAFDLRTGRSGRLLKIILPLRITRVARRTSKDWNVEVKPPRSEHIRRGA